MRGEELGWIILRSLPSFLMSQPLNLRGEGAEGCLLFSCHFFLILNNLVVDKRMQLKRQLKFLHVIFVSKWRDGKFCSPTSMQ